MGFGVEVQGGTAALEQRLGEREVTTFVAPITREAEGEHVPWFRVLGVQAAHATSRLSLFSLEYDPRFLSSWHANLPPASAGISRRAVLQRYAAKIRGAADGEREPLFSDVTEVQLALDEKERERLFDVLDVFGYTVEERADSWVCDGPQVRLVVRACERPRFEMCPV